MKIVHGIDVADVHRIASMVESHGQTFLDRCFTPSEQSYAEVNAMETRMQRYAARYAAKEAILKALGTGLAGGIEWVDINITREDGPPMVELGGKAAAIAANLGITEWKLSLSHTDTIAIASVIGIGGFDE